MTSDLKKEDFLKEHQVTSDKAVSEGTQPDAVTKDKEEDESIALAASDKPEKKKA